MCEQTGPKDHRWSMPACDLACVATEDFKRSCPFWASKKPCVEDMLAFTGNEDCKINS